jgi:hypothetical protein
MATGIGWLDPGLDLLPWKVRNVGIAASATTTKRATLTQMPKARLMADPP